MRRLIYHPESDCWFEVFNEHDLEQAFGDGHCVDVTGIEEHEKKFLQNTLEREREEKK